MKNIIIDTILFVPKCFILGIAHLSKVLLITIVAIAAIFLYAIVPCLGIALIADGTNPLLGIIILVFCITLWGFTLK